MSVRYTRAFKYRDRGSDVEGVGRALCRAGVSMPLTVFNALPAMTRRTWGVRKQRALKRFKQKHGLKADAIYGPKAHEKLSPFFDAKARKLMEDWHAPLPESERNWARLLTAMQALNGNTAGYLLGAGHGVKLDSLDPNDLYDCSSSTSKVLYEAGMFPDSYAWVSGKYATSYGKPGRGEYFTVYAHDGHVWIRLHKSQWWRFDTSPYGDAKSPKSGPRLRYLPRLTYGFTARHWPGM